MVAFLDQASTTNSCLVDILNDLGAVLYCKTNVPQTLMVCLFSNYEAREEMLPKAQSHTLC